MYFITEGEYILMLSFINLLQILHNIKYYANVLVQVC